MHLSRLALCKIIKICLLTDMQCGVVYKGSKIEIDVVLDRVGFIKTDGTDLPYITPVLDDPL